MYRQFFNLEKRPFQITSDNTFLWLGKKHATVLNLLQKGIAESCGMMALTGDIGTGKTTLVNEIIHSLDGKTQVVKIADPCFEIHQLYLVIAKALGFEDQFREKKFISELLAALKEADRKGNKILFIVDEAQRIPERFLKQIISWNNIYINPVLTILLVGQLELKEIFKDNLGAAWQDEFDILTRLEPLDEKETGVYISKRLEISGASREIFSKSAKHEAYCYSKGIPRLINISCDQAMMAAYSDDKKQVDSQIFKSVLPKLDLPIFQSPDKDQAHNSTFSRSKIFMFSAAASVCVFIAYSFFSEYLTSDTEMSASSMTKEVKFKISDPVAILPPVVSGVTIKPVMQESFETIYKSTDDKEIGLGYTPADIKIIKNVDEFIEDVFMIVQQNISGIKEVGPVEPLNEPDPNAIIDWLVNKKKSKRISSP